ncbi:hypothetical protein ASPZODRAFT_152040 [Penicilliopsis zonata CBS 506.65]|uniref:DNA repair protein Rhp26/Rad26 n=1 Tax=Penicilliopsis zonata CBS 506.65 TaxID=1073090 RepID=A0A1L9SHQ4_9EURO|nr:hypothetical protein ASPZODRAFT_152040 [Penicilliopsis zonata CBS 506.65]OJJ46574.1 hypothetical protein ASPZODRAFT_152040 [Penicilliopsis zonata CBS 506.65]
MSLLQRLHTDIRAQDDIERDLSRKADKELAEQADERDKKMLERTLKEKEKLETQILKFHQRLSQPIGTSARVRTQNEIGRLEERLSSIETDLRDIQERLDQRQQGQDDEEISRSGRLPNESRRDYLIRTGKITPFSNMGAGPNEGPFANLQNALIDAEDERAEQEALEQAKNGSAVSHRELRLPDLGFNETSDTSVGQKRRTLQQGLSPRKKRAKSRTSSSADALSDDDDDSANYVAIEETESEDEEEFLPEGQPERAIPVRHKTKRSEVHDDGNEAMYQTRLQDWASRRSAARKRATASSGLVSEEEEEGEQDEWYMPHPTVPDTILDQGLRIPGDIFPLLFDYQKTGVKWIWELHQQRVGGIIGDEMGLGKTIQVIAFLASLHHSKQFTKPALVVCPATLLQQWVQEFHRWWPAFRVSILHSTGSGMLNVGSESNREDMLTSQMWRSSNGRSGVPKRHKAGRKIVQRVVQEGHVLLTTYAGLHTYSDLLTPVEWGYVILDEGHKIRNPDTTITIYAKELRTPHRLILSGTPMQNNLTELWSLFDFVFPMRLGTLVSFRNQFDIPIRQGGYANASNLQVQTAARCAETLKDAISPFLLQRLKMDVAADLPNKSEQVLFCKLSPAQRTAYERFLASPDMTAILNKRKEVLYGIDLLRKICNHTDLIEHEMNSHKADYGNPKRSGKMEVVQSLLELWKKTGHKTLLFAQHKITLNILQKLISAMPGFNYRRMDGETAVEKRQAIVDEFNNDPEIHIFLLTTKVGGLGINLTGADRVIIFDPDWNPSTDLQARERAWRLGQKREVMICRLVCKGTIEEKIYHRQIYKQFLSNKILKDPKQRQNFQLSDLQDLFTLQPDTQSETETSKLFKDAQVTYDTGRQDIKSEEGGETRKIRAIAGVSGLEEYHDESEGKDKETDSEATNSEARIMQGIFSKSGVHSAMEHEQIVNGKRVIRADPKIIEAEAKRVAAEAAEELRRAGEAARSVPIGTPTWTGQSGVAGRPAFQQRGGASSRARRAGAGPSSASVLANLSSRGQSLSSSSASASLPTNGAAGTAPVNFLTRIRDFMISHGGTVYTQMLIDRFNHECDTPRRSAEFKEILRTIAEITPGGRSGRSQWTLKSAYARP